MHQSEGLRSSSEGSAPQFKGFRQIDIGEHDKTISDKCSEDRLGPTVQLFERRPDVRFKQEAGCWTLSAASIDCMLDIIMQPDDTDSPIASTFFLSFRHLMTASELLSLLVDRFSRASIDVLAESPAPNSPRTAQQITRRQNRVLEAIRAWFEEDWNIQAEPTLLAEAAAFLDSLRKLEAYRTVRDDIKFALRSKYEETPFDSPPPMPHLALPQHQSSGDLRRLLSAAGSQPAIVTMHPEEVARQMCLMDHQLFCAIAPRELFGTAWNKDDKAAIAPNVTAFIERFNQVSQWATTEVLDAESEDLRVVIITRLISIAQWLRRLNNFSSLMALVAALESSAVTRLEATWANIPIKNHAILGDLSRLVHMSSNFRALREAMSSCELPAIPYLGIFLSDLTFITDGNPDLNEANGAKLYNFEKLSLLAGVMSKLRRYREKLYNLSRMPHIQQYLSFANKKLLDANEAYARSKAAYSKAGDMSPKPKRSRDRTKSLLMFDSMKFT
eukprot:TRINITY_DN10772_c0_g1_i1.p1 TRINITY_DN10772_c0_g1~~TRINITY_DN10772_c0_g1_i1.p1  ORF type:complete len:501 (-),score=134.12 TRINITY_DN10772_c0_g1_i1:88-1590(-)